VFSNVTVGEREVRRFIRRFVFPGRVDVEGLETSLVDGLLKIDVPKLGEQSEWGYDLRRED
jgi:HSP20 family molecular chaperone IbpA